MLAVSVGVLSSLRNRLRDSTTVPPRTIYFIVSHYPVFYVLVGHAE